MLKDVRMPFIGEDINEARVSRILVRVRQRLDKDQGYIAITTDKVDIEIPSPFGGVVVDIAVEEGETVHAGQTLIRMTPEVDDDDTAEKLLAVAGLYTALNYFITLNSDALCRRGELGDLTFEAFKGFVDDAILLAQGLAALPLEDLDPPLQEELRAALFFVSDLTKQLVGFAPSKLGYKKFREHKRIYDTLTRESEYSIRLLRQLHLRARGGIEFDPAKAYAFIAYSHFDAEAAFELAEGLRMARLPYFLDRKTGFGERIPARVEQELRRASHMIVLISPASAQSPWIHYEVGFALARGIPIVPYLLQEGIQVPLFLSHERSATKADRAGVIDQLVRYKLPPEPGGRQLTVETWKGSAFARRRIEAADKLIWHQSMASYPSIRDSVSQLREFVRRGGQFWCILSNPTGEAMRLAAIRNVGETRSPAYLASQFRATSKLLAQIKKEAENASDVVLKTIDFVPEPILTFIDPYSDEGVLFVTLSGFAQNPISRPSLFLHKRHEPALFSFYTDSFLQLWEHRQSRVVDLDDIP